MTKPQPLAKISKPALFKVYPRDRLFKLLDEGRQHPIIWLKAPPGAGKTTLISNYIDSFDIPHIWYQFDSGDNEIASFFHYLELASQQTTSKNQESLPTFSNSQFQANLPEFTRSYFRSLYNRIKTPGILVFDNYQTAAQYEVMNFILQFALAEIPKDINVIIISRTDPPPTLARLQVNGSIYSLNWNDLRLTYEESKHISELFETAKEYDPSKLETIYEQTQGWIAGLVLLLEQNNTNSSNTLTDGTNREVIFDYFAGEIFQRSDEATQKFLLQTALLPKIDIDLARQLTSNTNATSILNELVQSNYFTVQHGTTDIEYEYHPLFHEFLIHRAHNSFTKEEISTLKNQAAKILTDNGELETAADLYIETENWQALTKIVLTESEDLIYKGRLQTLHHWLNSMPFDYIENDPWLILWYSVSVYPHDANKARIFFEKAYDLFKANKDKKGVYYAWVSISETYLYNITDLTPLDKWLTEYEYIKTHYPEYPSVEIEARVAYAMLSALMWKQPDNPDLLKWAESAEKTLQLDVDPNHRILVANSLIVYYIRWRGNLPKAGVILSIIRPLVDSMPIITLGKITVYMNEAAYSWVTNKPEDGLIAVQKGLELGEQSGFHLMDALLNGLGVYCHLTAGNYEEAKQYLDNMPALLENTGHTDVGQYHYLAAWVAMVDGNLLLAKEHAESALQNCNKSNAMLSTLYSNVTLAQVYLESGEQTQARTLLDEIKLQGERTHNKYIEFHYYFAIAQMELLYNNDQKNGLNNLEKALSISKAQGYIAHPWIGWRLDIMARLLSIALSNNIEVEYVQQIIRERRLMPSTPPLDVEFWPWPVRINAISRFSVTLDEKPCKIQGKSAEMLKILAMHPSGQTINEGTLTDILWPEADGDAAHHTFQTTLYRLRKKFKDHSKLLILKDGRLSLDPHHCWVDTWAIDYLLKRLEAVMLDNDKTEKVAYLSDKLFSLYPSAPGQDTPEEQWLSHEKLNQRIMRMIERLGQYWEKLDNWSRAIDCYHRGLIYNPTAEGFYQRLMECYKNLGWRAEALAVYQQCRNNLANHLKIEPSAATEAIHQSILEKSK